MKVSGQDLELVYESYISIFIASGRTKIRVDESVLRSTLYPLSTKRRPQHPYTVFTYITSVNT